MRYTPIHQSLYIENRNRLASLLKPNSIVILHSNDIMPKSSDGTMKFVQQTDLFYLTGINQEESILILFPDALEEDKREILFLRETNEHIAIWEGERFTKEKAAQLSGIRNVEWLDEFDKIFRQLMLQADHVYLNTNEHYRAIITTETRDARFIKRCMAEYPLHKYERIAPFFHALRGIKSPLEVEVLQKACDITEKGFRRVLGFVKPGVMEYEIEAEFIHEFVRNCSSGFSYEPIVASGANACVLHYVENNKECKDGDLLLMDIGAEYGGYAADMTRTIPVSGRFTKRQREVYDAVLRIHHHAAQLLASRNYNLKQYEKEVGKYVTSELITLGLLTHTDVRNQDPDKPAYKKYFMHGTSHHLGLDVHDYGSYTDLVQVGMVLTCEPGIYIREEGIGIRLENDLLITETGYFDLMKNIPIEAEEIEEAMNSTLVSR